MRPRDYIIILVSVVILSCAVSCSYSRYDNELGYAESMMEAHPDSALAILNVIDATDINDAQERARYALLMSMALDKNYIDTTTFDVLQPALDYFLEHGSIDEQLRTLYYQGRIYYNKGNRDKTLSILIEAMERSDGATDSLTIARNLVQQGVILVDYYDFEDAIDKFMEASQYYGNPSYSYQKFDCYLKALNGANITKNKEIADSILRVCSDLGPQTDSQASSLNQQRLTYITTFGTPEEISAFLRNMKADKALNPNGYINLATAYHKLGQDSLAADILSQLAESGAELDTLKYQAALIPILSELGRFDEAFRTHWDFSRKMDKIDVEKYTQKAKLLQEKFESEIKAHHDNVKKMRIIWSCIGAIVFLILALVIFFLLLRRNKIKKEIAIQQTKIITLEKENLAHKAKELENEVNILKTLLSATDDIPAEARQAILDRVEMLNSLLAGYISENDRYEKYYEKKIREMTDNTQEFMNTNRLAFLASHPNFIRYFEEHGLTVDEINYVCLYALGLKGIEVGNYMKKRSHVNISSAIRKKLGLDIHATNLGIYVRSLLKAL